MTSSDHHFSFAARLLHWLMAPLIVAMLFVGIGMVSTVTRLHDALLAIHRPLGIALLVLVVVRAAVRALHRAPPLPAHMPAWQRSGAQASHHVLYGLMAAQPLAGWAMLSAGGYPIVLDGALHLPPIVPHDVRLYALLRAAHTWFAFALFGVVLLHVGAALLHGLILRDGVFSSMARGGRYRRRT